MALLQATIPPSYIIGHRREFAVFQGLGRRAMAPAGTYKVQESPSGRAKCQACKEAIAKGALRLGVLIEIEGSGYTDWWKWRHWDCVTDRVVKNMEDPSNLQGLEELPQEYQDTVFATFSSPPPPKPRKQKAKTAAKDNDENEEAAAAQAAPADGKGKGKGKGKRGGAALGDTADAEVALPAAVEQAAGEPDPLEYMREDLGAIVEVMVRGKLLKELRPYYEGEGPYPGRLSELIGRLQGLHMLNTPWPAPKHEAQMRAKWHAAAAAAAAQEAAAAASAPWKTRAAKQPRTRRPRGYDSGGDWP